MQSYMREYKNSKLDVQSYFDTSNSNNVSKGGEIFIDKLMITKRLGRSAEMETSVFLKNGKNEHLSSEAQRILDEIDPKKLYLKYVWVHDESNEFEIGAGHKNEKK